MGKSIFLMVVACMIFAMASNAQEPQAAPAGPLTIESIKNLIRFASGEYVKVQKEKSLPCDRKKIAEIKVGEESEKNAKSQRIHLVSATGCQIEAGVMLQITSLDFSKADKGKLSINFNGGTSPKETKSDILKKIGQHTQVGMGGPMGGRGGTLGQPTPAPTHNPNDPPGLEKEKPATIVLEFKGPVPDMTPEDFWKYASPLIYRDPKKRSAAVQWIDTIPPEHKKAITDHRPMIGMDEETLVAAIGKPTDCGPSAPSSCKSREKNDEGVEVETWMYGVPPLTTFVYVIDHKVTKLTHPEYITDKLKNQNQDVN